MHTKTIKDEVIIIIVIMKDEIENWSDGKEQRVKLAKKNYLLCIHREI